MHCSSNISVSVLSVTKMAEFGELELELERVREREGAGIMRNPLEGLNPAQSPRLNQCIEQAKAVPYVPEPIRLKGIGSTTL